MCNPSLEAGQRVAPYLLNLTRYLIFLLLDVSDAKIDTKPELLRLINKLNLLLFDNMNFQHMIEVLVVLLKFALK
jgi:hypothetical protein